MKLVAVHAPCRLLYSKAHFTLMTSQAKLHDPIIPLCRCLQKQHHIGNANFL